MPGAGGGSHGGGGFSGGGFGGGSHGSSGGGGGYYRGGFFPFIYVSRGAGGRASLAWSIIVPGIFIVIAFFLILSSALRVINPTLAQDLPFFQYEEDDMYDYALAQYEAEFDPASADYEDHFLLLFLINEERNGYSWYSIVGDNLVPKINRELGGDETALGNAMSDWIPKNYTKSLSVNLENAMRELGDAIKGYGLSSSFKQDSGTAHNASASHVVNYTGYDLNEEKVNSGLVYFTEQTDIEVVLVVQDADQVLTLVERTWSDVMPTILMGLGILAFAVVCIVLSVKNYKKEKQPKDQGTQNTTGSTDQNGNFWY